MFANLTNSTKRARVLIFAAFSMAVIFAGCAQKARRPIEGERVLSHVVKGGESLEEIADDYYGDPDRSGEIQDFNLLKTNDVSEGDVLRIYMTPEDVETLERRKQARVPYNAGLELVARGSFLDATEKFRNAARLDPDFAEAEYNLGVTFQKLNAHDKAIDAFKRAIRLRSRKPDYFYALGESYFFAGRFGKAATAFEKVLQIDPNHLKAQYSLAAALEKDGKISRALVAWRRYLELDSDSDWASRARARLTELEQ